MLDFSFASDMLGSLKDMFGEQGRVAEQDTTSSPIDIGMAKATLVRNVIVNLKELVLLDVKIDC